MKTSTILVILAAVLIVGGGTWWYLNQNASMPESATVINSNTGSDYTPPASGTTASTTATSPATVAISYSASSGFSPKSVTVKVGDTLTFTATDGSQMWVASDPHPSHTGYDGTSRTAHCAAGYAGATPFDECGTAATYSFTLDKAGSFGFHNHMAPQNTGTVVVQ